MKLLLIISGIIILNSPAFYAQSDPGSLVKALSEKIQQVEKYSVDIRVTVEIDFVNIEERKAKVFFEKPDQFEIKSSGILLLPKKGVEMDYLQLFNTEYTAIDEKSEEVNGIPSRLIKVIPMDSGLDIILAQLWIDEENLRLLRMQTYTKSSGSYMVDFSYGNNPFDLPAGIRVEFDVKNMTLPSSMTGDFENLSKSFGKKGITKGAVNIEYSNYEVNGMVN